ncbi:DUF2339 domain-containing protein [Thermonema rossianum]|uniref:DUF2339 domain-containing protein n=1 Tax=Thermonema rossianum TaxID=55505 RepID=UPI00056EB2A8|nr:DUF2339 domain-containing protein [Thermonema rossianum]
MKAAQLEALEQKIQNYRRQLKQLLAVDEPDAQTEKRIKAITQELARLQESYERLAAMSGSQPQSSPEDGTQSKTNNWDQTLVRKGFAFAGIVLFVLGVLLLLAYAIDHGWLTPAVRIVLGYIAALSLLAVGIRQRPLGIRYASVWVAGAAVLSFVTSLYTVDHYALNHWGGIALMVVNMLVFLWYAYYYREEVIGVLGFVGGYMVLVPLRGLHADDLLIFTYIGILNTGISLLALRLYWWRTALLSFLTASFFLFLWVVFEVSFGTGTEEQKTSIPLIVIWYSLLYHVVFLFLIYRYTAEKLSLALWFLLSNIGFAFILTMTLYEGSWQVPATFAAFLLLHELLWRYLPLPRLMHASLPAFRLLAALFAIGTLHLLLLPDFATGEPMVIENDFLRLFPWSSLYLFGAAALYFTAHAHTGTHWRVIYYITGGLFLLSGLAQSIQFEENEVLWWQLLSHWAVIAGMGYLYRRLTSADSQLQNSLTVFFIFSFWFSTVEFINFALFSNFYDTFTLPLIFCFSVVYYLGVTHWAQKRAGLVLPAPIRYGGVPALAAFAFVACLASIESITWHIFVKDASPWGWLWRYAVYAAFLGLLLHQKKQLSQGNYPKAYVQANFYLRQIGLLLICSMEATGFYMIAMQPQDNASYQFHLDLSLRFVLSLSWLLLAAFWIYTGVRQKHLNRRRLGVLLALLSVLKILLIDVRAEATLSRIILFIVSGGVLLAASYLYQRYKDFLTDDNTEKQ